MSKALVTSAEAARLLGVSPSSIKRWADSGALECVRTPGQHRRFERAVVERFRSRVAESPGGEESPDRESPSPTLDVRDSWFDLLSAPPSPHALDARLADARARRGGWWRVADGMAPMLEEIGRRWQTGSLDILAEHELSEGLARALGRVAATIPVDVRAPLALVAVAEGEEHTLGLSLLEVCLREAGLRVQWAGRSTPLTEILAAVTARSVAMVAISASEAYEHPDLLAEQAATLDRACAAGGVDLLLGGRGPWPEGLPTARRIWTFAELHWLLDDNRGSSRSRGIHDES